MSIESLISHLRSKLDEKDFDGSKKSILDDISAKIDSKAEGNQTIQFDLVEMGEIKTNVAKAKNLTDLKTVLATKIEKDGAIHRKNNLRKNK